LASHPAVMIQLAPIKLQYFDFGDCYYYLPTDSSPDSFESRFYHGVSTYQPTMNDLDLGELINTQPFLGKQPISDVNDDVFLQVLQVMPFRADCQRKNSGYHLHELLLEVWTCRRDPFLGIFDERRLQMIRHGPWNLFAVLDRPVNLSKLHLFKRRHFCLRLSTINWTRICERSSMLRSQLDRMVEQGCTFYTGITEQQAYRNCERQEVASSLRSMVWDSIDLAYTQLHDLVEMPRLQGTSMVMNGDLEVIFAQREPSGDED